VSLEYGVLLHIKWAWKLRVPLDTHDIMIGILEEGIDLTIVVLSKTYLWTCRC